jgi:type IV pilus assembly protein PilE
MGFTLIEIMIVVVIVAVLVGIALPSYQESMLKGRRSEAMAGLLDVTNRQEQFMLDRGRYSNDMNDLGFGADPMITEEDHYSIDRIATDDCAIDAATCYVLRATPQPSSPQARDTKCGSFILENTGAKSVTGTLPAHECW